MTLENINMAELKKLHKTACDWLGATDSDHVIIAGGMLRDTWLGTKWKDVDVFTTCPLKMANAWLYPVTDQSEEYDHVAGHKFVSQCTVFVDGVCFNFIHYDPSYAVFNARTLIEGFDFSNCQIAFDGDALEFTERFALDVSDKVLRRVNNTVGTNSHGERMWAKFPDWAFIDDTEVF